MVSVFVVRFFWVRRRCLFFVFLCPHLRVSLRAELYPLGYQLSPQLRCVVDGAVVHEGNAVVEVHVGMGVLVRLPPCPLFSLVRGSFVHSSFVRCSYLFMAHCDRTSEIVWDNTHAHQDTNAHSPIYPFTRTHTH